MLKITEIQLNLKDGMLSYNEIVNEIYKIRVSCDLFTFTGNEIAVSRWFATNKEICDFTKHVPDYIYSGTWFDDKKSWYFLPEDYNDKRQIVAYLKIVKRLYVTFIDDNMQVIYVSKQG